MASPRVTLLVNGRRHALRRRTPGWPYQFIFRGRNVGDVRRGDDKPWPYVVAEVHVVHAYKCPAVRWNGKRGGYGACTCGAEALMREFVRPANARRVR